MVRIFIVTILFLICQCELQASETNNEKGKITIVFRYDDYSSLTSPAIINKVTESFRKYNFPCTFAVIPFVTTGDPHNITPAKVSPLTNFNINFLINAARNGNIEIALHGSTHQTIKKIDAIIKIGRFTEFSGLPYELQLKKILDGKTYLENSLKTKITTFVPPWDTYDVNTLKALEHLGFWCISADGYGKALESSALKYLPVTCNISQLRNAVNAARKADILNPIIIVLFHDYECDKDLYDDLEWIASQNDIQVKTINQTLMANKDLTASRYLEYNAFVELYRILPTVWLKNISKEIYYSANYSVILANQLSTIELIYIPSVFLLTACGVLYLCKILRLKLLIIRILLIVDAILLLTSATLNLFNGLGFKGVTSIIIFLGICFGLICFYINHKKMLRMAKVIENS